jgi:hypothetical protein
MKDVTVARRALFALLVAWGLGYIGWFAYLLRHSEDFIVAQRRNAVCSAGPRAVGDTMHFSADRVDPDMLAAGWSRPENWGVWSGAREALLVLPAPRGDRATAAPTLTMDLVAPTNVLFPLATVDVTVDGRLLAHWELREGVNKESSHSLSIPPELAQDRACIEFRLAFTHAFRPIQSDLGNDARLLGIGLKGARWGEAPTASSSGSENRAGEPAAVR